MDSRIFLTAIVSGSLIIASAPPVRADLKDFGLGVAVGGFIGSMTNQKKQTKKSSTSYTKRSASIRGDANVQRALNALGFNAGTVDGLFGKQTRNAIRQYQSSIGAKQTGQLTEDQKAALLSDYARKQRGNPGTDSAASGNLAAFVSTLDNQNPSTNTPVDATTEKPPERVKPLMITACDLPEVSGDGTSTSANEYTAIRTVAQAFCTGRSYVLSETAAKLNSEDESPWPRCVGLFEARGNVMLDAAIQSDGPETAKSSLEPLVSAIPAAQSEQVRSGFQVCHGLAMAAGEAEMALAFGTGLVALGEEAYGEFVAEQLSLGLGAPQSIVGKEWFLGTADALDNGANAIIGNDLTEYDHPSYLRAIAATTPNLKLDLAGYVTQRETVTAKDSGFDLVGLFENTPTSEIGTQTRDRYAVQKSLPIFLDIVLETTLEEALASCAGSTPEEIGLRVCKALALVSEDQEMRSTFEDRLATRQN